jgi:hypothetical protein
MGNKENSSLALAARIMADELAQQLKTRTGAKWEVIAQIGHSQIRFTCQCGRYEQNSDSLNLMQLVHNGVYPAVTDQADKISASYFVEKGL